jgi:uncharacterized membrane protein
MLASAVIYFVTLATFVAVDMAWLGTMASRFYKAMLGDIAIAGVNLPPAVLTRPDEVHAISIDDRWTGCGVDVSGYAFLQGVSLGDVVYWPSRNYPITSAKVCCRERRT